MIARIPPKVRVWFAELLVIATIIGWPLTQLTVARSEPPFVLGLSWFAILLTALDIVMTTDVRKQHEDS